VQEDMEGEQQQQWHGRVALVAAAAAAATAAATAAAAAALACASNCTWMSGEGHLGCIHDAGGTMKCGSSSSSSSSSSRGSLLSATSHPASLV
jgi:hypothetical protein